MTISVKNQLTLLIVLLLASCCLFSSVYSKENIFRRLIGRRNHNQVSGQNSPIRVSYDRYNQITVDNGMFQVTFENPGGHITGIAYKGINNLLNYRSRARGYWDIFWNENNPKTRQQLDELDGARFSIISQNEEQIEISFSRNWDYSQRGIHAPLNVDKRYIIRHGRSGIYAYAILERRPEWPEINMDAVTLLFKLNPDIFHYMALSDNRQKIMATGRERDLASPLDYKEAVHLTNPNTNPLIRGQVDDKYQYSCEDKDNKVHGWISDTSRIGFWMITPSNEFRMGGPLRQELTSHVEATTLNVFISDHYVGTEMNTTYKVGEAWKKVFGPVLVYLNSDSSPNHRPNLWNDAKRQMSNEVDSWPYDFIESNDFPTAHMRGSLNGQLFTYDRYVSQRNIIAKNAYIGLAPPGEAGSWQKECKGYQFWTQTDEYGNFNIKNVRPGNYNLYAWVDGYIGDYKYERQITITPGRVITLGPIVYHPPRNGPTLWEIGIPNRKPDELYIPNPPPPLMTDLYLTPPQNPEKFRQYGLWERYSELYPHNDLVYNVGMSDYSKDWFFAQVTRNVGNNTFVGTTWQINFDLQYPIRPGYYTLQLALASANMVHLRVNVNRLNSYRPDFTTGAIGRDNAIARHGGHGLYRLFSAVINSNKLHVGRNTIYLSQPKGGTPFVGFMYDYIRLEGPPVY